MPAGLRQRHSVDIFDGRAITKPAWEPHPWLKHITQDPVHGYNLIDLKWQRLKTMISRVTFRRWLHCLLQQSYVLGGQMHLSREVKELRWPTSYTRQGATKNPMS